MFLFATCVYLRGNSRVRLATQRKFLHKFNLRPLATTCSGLFDQGFTLVAVELSPGQTDRQVVASGRKLNLRRDLRRVAKRTRKFPRKYMQVAKKDTLRQTILYFIG